MKLDKTIEEIILQNKSLTEQKYIATRDYFSLRIYQEDKLSKLKKIQIEQIIENKSKLRVTKNISMEKIHKFAVKYKKIVNSDNIIKSVNLTFDDLISEFDYNCVYHYETNKDVIINYITEFFKLHLYMIDVKNELKLELKSFNRNISSALLIQLVSEYNIFKRNIEVITDLDYNFDTFKSHLEQQETLSPIITEIFLSRVEQLKNKKYIKTMIKEKENIEDIPINKKVESIKAEEKTKKKKEIYSIVLNSYQQFENNQSENNQSKEIEKSVEEIMLNNKETKELAEELCKEQSKKEKVKKPKLTKEERAKNKAIKEANDEMGLQAARNMFPGLI